MTFIQFLIDTPVMAFMLVLALLVTIVPAGAWLFRKKYPKPEETNAPPTDNTSSRFQGTQLDIAIVIVGLLLLLAAIGWIRGAFFG